MDNTIQDNIDHLVICMVNVLIMNQLDIKTIDTIEDTVSKLAYREELKPFVQTMIAQSKIRSQQAEQAALSAIAEAQKVINESSALQKERQI